MEYTLSRIIEEAIHRFRSACGFYRALEELSRIIEEAIHRFREQWKLKRPKNDDDPDLAYIAYMLLISIIVATIAGILSHLFY
jgi:hypothetical protein